MTRSGSCSNTLTRCRWVVQAGEHVGVGLFLEQLGIDLEDDLVLAGDVFFIQDPVELRRDGPGLRENVCRAINTLHDKLDRSLHHCTKGIINRSRPASWKGLQQAPELAGRVFEVFNVLFILDIHYPFLLDCTVSIVC
jgi:hypothetical protein